MGNNIISVLLPTRGRPEGLRRAIDSIYDLSYKTTLIEILVRGDIDDVTLGSFDEETVDEYIVGPRGKGYRDVYKTYNDLAKRAKGDWILNWNDDCEMLTNDFDELLRDCPSHSIQFMRRDILDKADTTFPVTGRSVYEAMGRLSPHIHADAWLGHVAEEAGVAVYRNNIVFHHERFNDQTSYDRDHGGYDLESFHSEENRALRKQDAEKIRAAVSK